jgi:predicted ester cyclase
MTETNRTLIHRYMGCLDRHDLERASAHLAPQWQTHGLVPYPLDVEEWMQALEALFEAFPDARFTITETLAEGERVAARHTFSGTHLAPFQGLSPTGRRVQIEAIVVVRVQDGQICEQWLSADFAGLLRQLGALPGYPCAEEAIGSLPVTE